MELTVFPLALGYRVRLLQDEKIQYKDHLLKVEQGAKQILEDRVNEKTAKLQSANKELHRMSKVDGLTGLYNRRFFDEALSREWGRLQRSRQPLSLIMGDIDHFKIYNDVYGHPAGDECLKTVAEAIAKGCARNSDIAVRYGGEEFVTILPEIDTRGAFQTAERIRQAIKNLNIKHDSAPGQKILTMSFGVATMTPDMAVSPAVIVKQADMALYASKNAGWDRVIIEERMPVIA